MIASSDRTDDFYNLIYFYIIWASLVAQTIRNLLAVPEIRVRSLGWEDPLEKGMATHSSIFFFSTPVSLLREFHGQRSLMGYSL